MKSTQSLGAPTATGAWVAVVFGVNGFAMASWASRLPAIRDELRLSPGHLGLVLLALSAGSVATLPWAGVLIRRFGPGRTVAFAAAWALTGVTVVGVASVVWLLALGLLMTGSGLGAWDVAMNVEGAEVERRSGRAIMPRFHAAFSLGTVFGAGVGAVAAVGSVPVRVHLPLVAGAVLLLAVFSARRFLPSGPPDDADRWLAGNQQVEVIGQVEAGKLSRPSVRRLPSELEATSDSFGVRGSAWLEPATLLIGVLVFSMALAEGSANDWLTLAVVDGYGAVHALGAAAFGVFVTGMTVMRMVGPAVLGRFDHVLVLRCSAGLVLLGTGLVIVGALHAAGQGNPIDYAAAGSGALLWGMGAALGFPMGMTAAAVDPRHAAARVSVVSTIGYTAFLAGPPLLGALGQRIEIAQSLVGVSAAVLLSLATAGAVRQPGQAVPSQP